MPITQVDDALCECYFSEPTGEFNFGLPVGCNINDPLTQQHTVKFYFNPIRGQHKK